MFRTLASILATMVVCAPCLRGAAVKQAQPPQSRTQIVLLGTGTPNADPARFGPSVAIVVNDTPYLVDFGPGVVRRAAAAFAKGVKGLDVKNLDRAFLTHLHSDHTAGYPDLILTPWVLGRTQPLQVFGPKGIKPMTENLMRAYKEDIEIRLNGGEPSNKTGYRVIARDLKPGVVYKDQNVTINAFPVVHGTLREAYGFRFETPDRTIVISGDCRPSQSVVENCNGGDVLIHEVYSQAGYATRPPEWQRYHASFHTSTKELADIASRAKPGLLIVYHQLLWGTTVESLLKEIRDGYSGKVVSGSDLDIY